MKICGNQRDAAAFPSLTPSGLLFRQIKAFLDMLDGSMCSQIQVTLGFFDRSWMKYKQIEKQSYIYTIK